MPTSRGGKSVKTPQENLTAFWDKFITKAPGTVTSIFPQSLYTHLLPSSQLRAHLERPHNAAESYGSAANECRRRVTHIVAECRRTNEKFTDPDFDIEADLGRGDCLHGLLYGRSGEDDSSPKVTGDALRSAIDTLAVSRVLGDSVGVDLGILRSCLDTDAGEEEDSDPGPQAVHRIEYIFEEPSFLMDGFGTADVRQGSARDCWLLSAAATICSMPGLMDRVCVARDEECGVYGFVFLRDGEWISTIVDDNLYLTYGDWISDAYENESDADDYKQQRQTGSKALFFAKCREQNETWLPLLEKAYAKVHGDYDAIGGGIAGEAVEDMTGGVTTSITTTKILSKDRLWEELLMANKDFLFAVSSPHVVGREQARGLTTGHAYSLLKAVEEVGPDGKKVRLVLIRNCWGSRSWTGIGEWNGPWSDGSKEWTSYWMQKLNHRFGDDGEFWMSYKDMLRYFRAIDRTRIFDDSWTVVQEWATANVSWVTGYLHTKFVFEIKEPGLVVVVLSQLDSRYFVGLEGQYEFELHCVIQCEGGANGEQILRARCCSSGSNRSVNAELYLEPGRYEVLPKILASRDSALQTVEDVVKEWADKKPQKLRQIGLNYDIANAKGIKEVKEVKKDKVEKKEGERNEEEETKKEEETTSEKPKQTADSEDSSKDKSNVTALIPRAEESSVPQKDGPATEPPHKDLPGSVVGAGHDIEGDKPTPSPEIKDEAENKEEDKDDHKEEKGEGDKEEEKGDDDPEDGSEKDDDESKSPWNAVCVIGLRVYSKCPQTTVEVHDPKDDEEGAALEVGGNPAGATM